MSEQELIRKLKDGSSKAFEEVYQLYSKRLYGFCLRFTKSSDVSQDLVQEVFVRLWVHRARITHTDSLAPLLFTIARNQLIKNYNKVVRSPVYEQYVAYCNRLQDAGSDTQQRVEYEDFYALVRQAVAKLSPAQRQIVEYSKFNGMSNGQVAEVLGLSEQTVKNQLCSALKTLRKELSPLLIPLYLIVGLVFF